MTTDPIFPNFQPTTEAQRSDPDSSHTVQFYADDDFMMDSVTRFVGAALDAGNGAVVFATSAHRERIARMLQQRGLNVAVAEADGRYVPLDAQQILSRFMVQGWPNAVRFEETIVPIIEEARRAAGGNGRHVAAFGEMVALLAEEGKPEAAIRLEEMWNDLARKHCFYLRCAYSIGSFRRPEHSESVLEICAEHTHVIPTETYAALPSDQQRAREVAVLQQKAVALDSEAAARASLAAQVTDFLENAVVPMHWVAADGTILWANQAELDLLGYSRDEYIGRHVADFHADPEVIADILQRLARNQDLHGYEARLRCRDGSLRHVRIHSNVFRENGKFVHTRCVTIDVTDAKAADEARRLLAAIVESCDDAIASKDLNGIVTTWNAAAERIFGYPADEIVGKSIKLIIPPELYCDEDRILEKIRRGERVDHFETVRLTKSGERIHISLTVSPVRDGSGKIIGAAKIARDITERKRAQTALLEAEKLAATGRMAVTIAHEINNPLEAITNLLFLLRPHAQTEEARRYLAMAESELDRVAHITRQTLGFYREMAAPDVVSLPEVIDSVLTIFTRKIARKRVAIVRLDQPCSVRAVKGELRQLFSNIVDNAIDAVPASGRIEISMALHGSEVIVSIADNGPGICPDHLSRVFEPFFTTKQHFGTGLGLWVAQQIAAKHGGTISARSSTDPASHGTTFQVTLAACAAEQSASAAEFTAAD